VSTVLNHQTNILIYQIDFIISCFKYRSSIAELGALHVVEFSSSILNVQNAKRLFGTTVRCVTDVPATSKHGAAGVT